MSLARSLWEIAITMAAINRNIVKVEDVFGGHSTPGQPVNERAFKNRIEEADRLIQKKLIWENPDLNAASRHAVNVFLNIINQSTHKSNLGMAIIMKRAQEGKPISFLPEFDKAQTEMAGNIINLVTWALMITLNYFGSLLPERNLPWGVRYSKALIAFEELNRNPPNPVLAGFGDVMGKVLNKAQGSTITST